MAEKTNDETKGADQEVDSRPVVLQSPKKGLELVFDMGETAYLPSGGWRVKRPVGSVAFERGVCTVSREKWESLGFQTRKAFLAGLRAFQRKGSEFVIREDIERQGAGRSAPSTPPLVIPTK